MNDIDNPYYDMMMNFDPSGMKKYFPRLPMHFMDLWRTYTWGIVPSNDDARFIARFSPLLEIGAGSGYWARLISQAGAKIDAYDALIPGSNVIPLDLVEKTQERFANKMWYPVKRGNCAVIKQDKYNGWTLLMIRPPSNPDLKHMALDCISQYKGDVFVYAGEIRGSNASTEFFDHLDAHFDMVDAKRCIQTSSYPNFIIVYARKGIGCSNNDAMIRKWITRPITSHYMIR